MERKNNFDSESQHRTSMDESNHRNSRHEAKSADVLQSEKRSKQNTIEDVPKPLRNFN